MLVSSNDGESKLAEFKGDDENAFVERMLERGYYPEALPPVFEVENLHEASIKFIPNREYLTDKPTEHCRFNSSKRGNQRRIFSIPNPIAMFDMVTYFIQFEDHIGEHVNISTDSCSIPRFSSNGNRPFKIDSHPEFHKKRRNKLASSRFIIKTDISRFYYSIYTHALPWALHGKAASKKDRKTDSAEIFGNKLDWIMRQSQDGQTVGIPVGPDISRLVAEIIGVSIDNNFRRAHKDAPMLRLVDDIFIGADNRDEASTYLSAIRDSIRSFELDINEAKTAILSSSEDLEPYWPVELRREIRRFSEEDGTRKAQKRADFVYFLDKIIRESNERGDEGIIKFALRKIDEMQIWPEYWDLIEPFLIKTAISFPHCWDYLARIVAWRNTTGDVDTRIWSDVIEKAIAANARSGNDFEVSWALWLAKELKTTVSAQNIDNIVDRCGPLSVLLSMDVHKSCNLQFKFPKEKILDRIGEKPMLGPNWLLAYEADQKFDYKIKAKNLQGNGLFKQLYDDNVSFYNTDAVIPVFKNKDNIEEIKSAIEISTNGYDDVYGEEPENEDEADDIDF